jgi:gamma-glutamyltranspeptidase/glutathione hydrolase
LRFSTQYERLPVYGREHAIATSHPTATQIGAAVLAAGGNAVDAALAAHAVLAVAEPGMTGVGGDCFVLYYDARRGKLVSLSGSGPTPAGQRADIAPDALTATSGVAVTIPGAVDAWCMLHAEYGTKDLDELFAPAIRLARDGYVVHARVAFDWASEAGRLASDPVARDVFLTGGRAPRAGDRHAQPLLADTLAAIARKGRAVFYEGAIAEDMVATLRQRGGAHRLDDFAGYHATWTTPIETAFAGHRIAECPPNGQGVIALLLLNILRDARTLREPAGEGERLHLLAEATKLAYGIRDDVLADPRYMRQPVAGLLDGERSLALARSIGEAAAGAAPPAPVHGNDTTYLCAVDRDGNAVSFINSIYDCFGSCIVTPKAGVLLNNRGMCFTTTPGHPNCIGPGKLPLQTIIPGMILDESGALVGPFGVMGGHYQATGHADYLWRLLVEEMDPQAALNAPRTFATEGVVRVEATLPTEYRTDLARRGHQLVEWPRPIGGGQGIVLDRARGVLVAGSDPRKDGAAAAL